MILKILPRVSHLMLKSAVAGKVTLLWKGNGTSVPVVTSRPTAPFCNCSSLLTGVRTTGNRRLDSVVGVRLAHQAPRHISRKDCIILVGSPGCGKTSVGRLLGSILHRPVIDVDNDHLEKYWGTSVAAKLAQVGSDGFVEEEGHATLSLSPPEGSVISLTGSNPMYPKAMDHLSNMGISVFLDVRVEDIIQRLEQMKVDRIVGQESGMTMVEILQYRQQFYEKCYDIRILCEADEPIHSIVDKIVAELQRYNDYSGYVSTRFTGAGRQRGFNDVVLEGLASDGGLYVPAATSFPSLSLQQWKRLVTLDYKERALRVLEKWIHPSEMHPSTLASYLHATYSLDNFGCARIIPVHHLQGNQYIMELFHGPTASFKDVALQLMPKFFQHALQQSTQFPSPRYLILVATSGDTGGAVLHGFTNNSAASSADVFLLYPEHGVSHIQKAQMTSVSSHNVKVIGINSDFDFCQSAIKDILNDGELEEELKWQHGVKLSAANSINWGRLLPQVVYHCSAYLDLAQQGVIRVGDSVDLCVPTGNFGNILAAYYAKQMGIPFKRLIIASNENKILHDFLKTGHYDLTGRQLQVTASPAIDILKSSNLERYLYHLTGANSLLVTDWYTRLADHGSFRISDEAHGQMQEEMSSGWCTEEKSLRCIRATFEETGYLLDTHTAVAKAVADHFDNNQRPLLIASTAHYAKFGDTVLRALGQDITKKDIPDLFRRMEKLEGLHLPKMHEPLKNAVLRPRIEKTVSEPNIRDIVERVKKFVNRN